MSDAGTFNIPDDSSAGAPDLNTLFGVAPGVAAAPVLLDSGGYGFSQDPQGHGMRTVPMVAQKDAQGHTVQGALNMFYSADPEVLANLQQQLYAGHFYADSYYTKGTKKRPQFGAADDDSFAAYKKAVVQAARSGAALTDVLSTAAASTAAGAAGETPVQFTHPDDLRAALDSVGPNVIGRRPDPAIYDNFVAGYHEMESAAANQTDSGGNVTAPPSPTAAAEQYLRRTFPADAYRAGYVDAFDAFRQMIAGGQSGG